MLVFATLVLGLIIGSFLNAVIYRLHSGQSIFDIHSRCPHCRHELAARDLIPLLSFVLLRGKCRYCQKPISWQYPLVELATGISFVLVYSPPPFLPHPPQAEGGIEGGGLFELLFKLLFVCFLIIIFVYDLKHYLILDKVVFPAAVLALVYQIWQGNLLSAVLGLVFLAGFFAFLYFISRGRWIGAGDVKLGVFLGLLVPWPETLVLFFLAYFIGAAFALLLVALGRKTLADRLPFGTFLTLAAFIAMLYGEELVSWYFRLIGLK